jgi:hypothetical protein
VATTRSTADSQTYISNLLEQCTQNVSATVGAAATFTTADKSNAVLFMTFLSHFIQIIAFLSYYVSLL